MASVKLFWRGKGRQSAEPFPGSWAWLDVHDDRGRLRTPLGTQDPAEAAGYLKAAEARQRQVGTARGASTVSDVAARYLEHERMKIADGEPDRIARSSMAHREQFVATVLAQSIGDRSILSLTPEFVGEWWAGLRKRYAPSTLHQYVSFLSSVCVFSIGEGELQANPVPTWRQGRRGEGRRTKASEASKVLDFDVIERLEDVDRILVAARAKNRILEGAILHGVDAGLRVGETHARDWSAHVWGADFDDPTRRLIIDRNHPAFGDPGEVPKSGKLRKVHMSRRLRRWLFEERMRRGNPERGLIFPDFDPSLVNYHLRALCRRIGAPYVPLKNLRHTYASQMLSAGFPLGFVSKQMGHAQVSTTVRHYARWLHDDYVEPPKLGSGDLPCDWLCVGTRGHSADTREAVSD